MDLSVIIVNWNSSGYLRKCLSTLYGNTGDLRMETIVVDNASNDGCEDLISQYFPQVCFIDSRKNLGFANANNLGFRRSTGSVVLFLNPDTEVIDGAIQAMYRSLGRNPPVGLVGCQLLNSDLSVQTSAIQPFPTIWNQFWDSRAFDKILLKLGQRSGREYLSNWDQDWEVPAVSGACMMLRKETFEQVGLFSTDYFMYSEDIDLCYKVMRAGLKINYVANAKVIHHGGKSSGQKTETCFSALVMRQSIWKFLRKTRGRVYASLYKLAMTFTAVARLSLLLFLLPFARVFSAEGASGTSVRKWYRVFRWSLGLETGIQEIESPVTRTTTTMY